MLENDTQRYVVTNAEFLVILGLLMGALGLIAIGAPLAAGLAIEVVVGGLILCRGSMQLYYGIKVRHWGETFGSYLGLGSIIMSFVSVACGVLIVMHPLTGLNYLTLLLAAYLIVNGGFDLLHSIELKSANGWYFVFLNGLVGVTLGIMVWQQWPLSGSWAVGVLFGLGLGASGASLVGVGIFGRWTRIQQSALQQT